MAYGVDVDCVRTRLVIFGSIAVAVIAVLAGPWGPRMIDLEVYRAGAAAILSGHDLYAVREANTGLPFTYPVFAAALLFTPFAVVPTLVARFAMTALSLAALYVICHVTLRSARLRWPAARRPE